MKFSLKNFINFNFIFELFIFSFSLFLAFGLALQLLTTAQEFISVYSTNSGAGQFIVVFLLASVLLFVILKYFKKPGVIKFLFYLAVIEGLWYFSQAYFPWPNNLYLVLFFVSLYLIYRNVFIHNMILMLAVSAIAVIFGSNIWPSTGIIILLFLAIYDFWAVYKTKHMVKMFQSLVESKVHFAFIIPHDWRGLYQKLDKVSPNTEFMFLGTGDIALPAIFIVSCLKISISVCIVTALGAIAGFIFLHLLFVTQKQRAPMPGLPPIVLGTLLGFLIALML